MIIPSSILTIYTAHILLGHQCATIEGGSRATGLPSTLRLRANSANLPTEKLNYPFWPDPGIEPSSRTTVIVKCEPLHAAPPKQSIQNNTHLFPNIPVIVTKLMVEPATISATPINKPSTGTMQPLRPNIKVIVCSSHPGILGHSYAIAETILLPAKYQREQYENPYKVRAEDIFIRLTHCLIGVRYGLVLTETVGKPNFKLFMF